MKIMLKLKCFKKDNLLDIETIKKDDKDYKEMLISREERKKSLNDYQDFKTINWK